MMIKRRTALKLGTAAAASLAAPHLAMAQSDVVKIGAVAPKTGPLAGGSTVTQWPNIALWASEVNAKGGMMVDGGKKMVEVIEYDDQTNPGETIKAVQRLATQDKADFIVAPYGKGLNIAAAPLFDRYKYPQLAVSVITDQFEDLSGQFNSMFFLLGSTTAFVKSVVDVLAGMQAEGTLTGNKIAMVNVADAFGIELATAARPLFADAGFEIVYDTSYPLGTQDLSPVVKGAKASQPNAFVAWSYPPDTFGLTEQAIGAVGMDREGVTEHITASTFDTVLGDMAFDSNNFNPHFWTVGQWQGGVYQGVAETGRDGAKPVLLKQGWA